MTANVSIVVAQKDNVLEIKNAALRYYPAAEVTSGQPMSRSLAPASARGGAGRDRRTGERTVYVLSEADRNPCRSKQE